MKTRKGLGSMAMVVLIALAGVGVFVGAQQLGLLSAAGGEDTGISDDLLGTTADVDAKAKDVGDTSSPDVAVPVSLYQVMDDGSEEFITSGTTNSDGSRTSLTGLTVGESFASYYGVDNATYYGDRDPATESERITAEVARSEGEVNSVAAAGNIGLTVFDEDDSKLSDGGSVTVGSGDTYRFERMRVAVNAENEHYNFGNVYINDTQLSNVDEWRIDGASTMDVPEKLSEDTYGAAFDLGEAGDLTSGESPSVPANEQLEFGQIELDMEDGADPSGDVQICTDDQALTKGDNDDIRQDVEDDSDADLGQAAQCFTVTIS